MEILGVRVDNFSKEETLEKIRQFLQEDKFHQIATVNQEFILEAKKNPEFREVLNHCDLNVADSVGVKMAFWENGEKLKARIPGADLVMDILKIAKEKGCSIFIASSRESLSSWKETRDSILSVCPNLEISGDDIEKKDDSYKITNNKYQILLCNFGAPFQEIFLARQQGTGVRLALGVGGSFDFITGKIRRAPLIWRRLGIEWLWRLILEPHYRAKRVWNALIVFPIKILFSKNY